MRSETDGGPADSLSATQAEPPGAAGHTASLVREQAAIIAHYKKMYDRSSALAKIGVWEYDLEAEQLTWTDGVYDLFELPRGSPVERAAILEMYDPESRREMEKLRADVIRDGGSFTLDIRIRTARGQDRWLRLTADVERENGRSVRVFGAKQDITQERRAQETVRALQAELLHMSQRGAMGTMATTLAHELNQPLAALLNFVAGMRRALTASDPAAGALERGLDGVERCAARAAGIIRSFRAMTDGKITRRRLDPNPLIREAAAMAMVGEDDILRLELADGIEVLVDPVQFQQVVINLVRNAHEAVQERPRREVVVSSSAAGGAFRIHVDDTGPGLPPGLLAAPFESVVSSKPQGMGIGLSISRTIVEAHGGKISAANRETGGARLCVELPFAGDDASPVEAASPSAAG